MRTTVALNVGKFVKDKPESRSKNKEMQYFHPEVRPQTVCVLIVGAEDGVTCLMKAASARSPDMVTALVERGADVSAADHDEGRTALHYAIRVEVPFDGDFSEGDAPEMPGLSCVNRT